METFLAQILGTDGKQSYEATADAGTGVYGKSEAYFVGDVEAEYASEEASELSAVTSLESLVARVPTLAEQSDDIDGMAGHSVEAEKQDDEDTTSDCADEAAGKRCLRAYWGGGARFWRRRQQWLARQD